MTIGSYRQSGVDIEEGNRAVDKMKEAVRRTYDSRVLSDVGHFAGLFAADFSGMDNPVLVASTDGVGTKLKVAAMASSYRSTGRDLVNHCVNDILVQGAAPLFFMDYIACGRLDSAIAADIVSGLADACSENNCVLLGGETAEMPGFYSEGDYDVAGTVVGVVERDRIIDGRGIEPGMKVIGLPSTGLHTNGYSLARMILFESAGLTLESTHQLLGGRTVGEVLLEVHRSYLHCMRPLLDKGIVRGLCHVTGGGIPGNLKRILPEGCAALLSAIPEPPGVFALIAELGDIAPDEMHRTFNMGTGMLIVVEENESTGAIALLEASGERPFSAGEIVPGEGQVRFE
jgi:phosphoribosylformylglycinamidine cyclo-ligase